MHPTSLRCGRVLHVQSRAPLLRSPPAHAHAGSARVSGAPRTSMPKKRRTGGRTGLSQPPPSRPVVLELSARNATGFMGVTRIGARFKATTSEGVGSRRDAIIGWFKTAEGVARERFRWKLNLRSSSPLALCDFKPRSGAAGHRRTRSPNTRGANVSFNCAPDAPDRDSDDWKPCLPRTPSAGTRKAKAAQPDLE